jgi:hypothetical protein
MQFLLFPLPSWAFDPFPLAGEGWDGWEKQGEGKD